MSEKRVSVDIEFGGETLTLLAQKAVVWSRARTLFVADVHLGKAASFRAAGLAVPSGHSRDDLDKLTALIAAHQIEHLVVLGDLVHNRASYTAALDATMSEFANKHPALRRTLVMGNHDSSAGKPPFSWGFTCIDYIFRLDPFTCLHEPFSEDMVDKYAECSLSGHLHPATWLRTARDAINLPCFWLRKTQLVLPSFGSLTGRFTVEPEADDVTFVVTTQQIFRTPRRPQ